MSSLGVSGGLLQISQKGLPIKRITRQPATGTVEPRGWHHPKFQEIETYMNNTVIYAVRTERERESANYKLPGYLCKKKHPPPLKQSNPQLHLPMELSNLDCDSFGAEFIPRCLEVVDLRRCWLPGGCQNQLINQQTYK